MIYSIVSELIARGHVETSWVRLKGALKQIEREQGGFVAPVWVGKLTWISLGLISRINHVILVINIRALPHSIQTFQIQKSGVM